VKFGWGNDFWSDILGKNDENIFFGATADNSGKCENSMAV
jgi:hypothetical protein